MDKNLKQNSLITQSVGYLGRHELEEVKSIEQVKKYSSTNIYCQSYR